MGYFGSKATSGLCQPLIAMMPPHDTYIETHLGGGALMRRKPAALHNIGIDRDARALGEFECDYPVELIHGCAHRFLSEYAFEGSELIYSDPPYLKRTRSSRHRYRFDYEEADHLELLELLKAVRCQVMVSGYGSALYEERLEGWRQRCASGDEPRGGSHRVRVDELPRRPAALGALRGEELHRPPAHQAQGPELGPALHRAAGGLSASRCWGR